MTFNREDLYLDICKDLSGIYIEVGTCWGTFSKFIIKHLPYSILFCVDPYRIFNKYEYMDALNLTTQNDLDIKFNIVQSQLTKLSNRCKMLRVLSQEAISFVKDDSVSFVYIDANHEYRNVKNDILMWIKKVRPGGIIAGDDVESIDLYHNSMGNAFILHKPGGPFSVCGVHKALIDIRTDNPWFDYVVCGSQFYWKKPRA